MYYISKQIIDGQSVSFKASELGENCFYADISDLLMDADFQGCEQIATNHYKNSLGDDLFISEVADNYFESYVFN